MLNRTASAPEQDGLLVFGTLADVPREPVSQDPLGFGPSAERLADVFAPGLTVDTRSVRYYQLLAGGVHIAAIAGAPDARTVVLRLERMWALASYLSDPTKGEQPGSGLAGISRVRLAARPQNQSQQIGYRMFQGEGQARLGVWGLYRRSAEQLLLVDGQDPTPLGSRLAFPMVRELDRLHLRRAAVGKLRTAATASLTGFGAAAGLFAAPDAETAEAAWDALRNEPNRRAVARVIRTARDNQDDLLATVGQVPQFADAARAAQAIEVTFVALTRLLDAAVALAEQSPAVDSKEIRNSSVLVDTLRGWKGVAARMCYEMAHGAVDPAVVSLGLSVADGTDPWDGLLVLIERHHQVQEAKARQPWLEWRGQRLVRAAASPQRSYDPLDPNRAPRGHDFRLRNLRQLAREIHEVGVKLT